MTAAVPRNVRSRPNALPHTDNPLHAWVRALERTAPYAQDTGPTLPALVSGAAAAFGDRPALLSDGGNLSYGELAGRMAQYSRWTLEQGLAPGDVVGLMLPNCADYVAIWLGITAVGGVVALINPTLAGDALLHALSAVATKHLIVGAEPSAAVAGLAGRLPAIPIWSIGGGTGWPRLDEHLARIPSGPLRPHEQRPPALRDLALHIYTSGTTGLPKAANVSHRRIAEWCGWFAGLIDVRPDDRMYNCLPMSHSVGGVVAIGAMLAGGGSVLIRPKFSATRFWDDIVDGDCTLFQYIGELCRYLVNTPPHPRETAHRLRLCCGNGLRGDVWTMFQDRFAIPRILEFYAATEGNVSLYNVDGRPGAIGRVPGFLAHRFPIALVRCDPATRVLARGEDGLCIRCARDEPGEALGRISSDSGRPFEGYADAGASEAKIARNVLAAGDAWFRTGDLMRRDAAGFYYFVDRLGDTFRWKGENVATEQVAETLRGCPGVTEAVVYGVAVPGNEGRAGMAALTVDASFDLAAFRGHLAGRLADYARPLFLRLMRAIPVTGTFKPAAAMLATEGYDPDTVADPLYIDDRARAAYVPLDRDLHARIETLRL